MPLDYIRKRKLRILVMYKKMFRHLKHFFNETGIKWVMKVSVSRSRTYRLRSEADVPQLNSKAHSFLHSFYRLVKCQRALSSALLMLIHKMNFLIDWIHSFVLLEWVWFSLGESRLKVVTLWRLWCSSNRWALKCLCSFYTPVKELNIDGQIWPAFYCTECIVNNA